jgi:hypothetical protein
MVIVDECSMIQLDILDTIFDDIRYANMKKGDNFKKVPKVIFTGDPAQLPPVSEPESFIFIKSDEELTNEDYVKYMDRTDMSYVTSDMASIIEDKRKELVNDILSMDTFLLKKVVRSKLNSVTTVCHEIRRWVKGEVEMPELSEHMEKEGVHFFKYNEKYIKTKTKWFKKCIKRLKNNECSIILTWTNEQTNKYNMEIRKLIFGKKNKERFLKGDILMLTEFYCLDIDDDKLDSRFYTSDQIIVEDTDNVTFKMNTFEFHSTKGIRGMKGSNLIENRCHKFIAFINSYLLDATYKCWALCVKKIGNDGKKYHVIRVLDETEEDRFNRLKNEISGYIIDFSRKMISNYKEKQKQIERLIIKPIWKQWHSLFIVPFANVSYGYSITCHKGQGSNFYNVFVDVHDILKNHKETEFKKCIYTAVTRTINELYLLI